MSEIYFWYQSIFHQIFYSLLFGHEMTIENCLSTNHWLFRNAKARYKILKIGKVIQKSFCRSILSKAVIAFYLFQSNK